jgi:hypothetical protein
LLILYIVDILLMFKLQMALLLTARFNNFQYYS